MTSKCFSVVLGLIIKIREQGVKSLHTCPSSGNVRPQPDAIDSVLSLSLGPHITWFGPPETLPLYRRGREPHLPDTQRQTEN